MCGGEVESSDQADEIVHMRGHLVVVTVGNILVGTSVAPTVQDHSVLRGECIELTEPSPKVTVATVHEDDAGSAATGC